MNSNLPAECGVIKLVLIGFVDDYGNNFFQPPQVLGWSSFHEHHVNKSSRAEHPISADIIDQISRMNAEDIAFYEYARSPKEAAVGLRPDA
jgi:hypothetical protein